jgi:hypothetical protein
LRRISEVRRGKGELRKKGRPKRPCRHKYRHETDAAIQLILQQDLNASLRTIAETLSISPETVRTDMSQRGHPLKALHRIPQALTCELKQVCLSTCLQLLSKLRARTTTGGISSWGKKAAFPMNMFGIEYEQHGMKTCLKSKTRQLRPDKVC